MRGTAGHGGLPDRGALLWTLKTGCSAQHGVNGDATGRGSLRTKGMIRKSREAYKRAEVNECVQGLEWIEVEHGSVFRQVTGPHFPRLYQAVIQAFSQACGGMR